MTAAAIVDVELTPEQELYRAEKARRADRVRPEMIAAAAELQRQTELMREQRKGGRPKGNPFNVGKGAQKERRLGRTDEPDAPGRPEWLDAQENHVPKSIDHPPPRAIPIMPEMRPATECGHDTPRRAGPAPKLCDDCKPVAATKPPIGATKRPSVATKPAKRATKPARAEKRPTRREPSEFGGAIADLQAKIDALDARREKLVAAIAQLQEIDAE